MNDYQKEPVAPSPACPKEPAVPASDNPYVRKETEADRRYRELKKACASLLGAKLALGGLALGILTVELALLYPAGLSMPVLILGFEALLFGLFRERIGRDFWILGTLLLLTAAGYPLHFNPSTRPICSLGLLLGGALQLAALEGAESPLSVGTLLAIPRRLAAEPLMNLALPFPALGTLRSTKSRMVRSTAAVLLGLALALPVCGMLLLLFASADTLFGVALDVFLHSLCITPFAVFCDFVFGGVFGLLLAARLLKARFAPKEGPAAIPAFRIPALVSGAFLAAVVAVTLVFVGFQFAYLFGGERTRAAWGLTYSEYARRGFFELCAASAIVFGVALLALLLTRSGEKGFPCGVRILTILLCAGDFVILASALRRMSLYISVYGMSVKRLLTLWGMAVIAAGLLLLLLRCLRERFQVVRALLITGLAAVCLLSFLNTERIVAGWNVRRMTEGSVPFSAESFRGLSYTAAPQVEALLEARPESREELDEVLGQMTGRYASCHPIYSFSFDQWEAGEVFERRGLL